MGEIYFGLGERRLLETAETEKALSRRSTATSIRFDWHPDLRASTGILERKNVGSTNASARGGHDQRVHRNRATVVTHTSSIASRKYIA